jgi:IclR family transcriptional regulator, acetate operon repressor
MGRWLTVLEAFVDHRQWGVRELAAASGLSVSATHRILHEMASLGMLSAGPKRGQFTVGPELTRIAILTAERVDLKAVARPVIEAASQDIGETVILASYSPVRRQFWAVDAAESDHTIRYLWESLRRWSDIHVGSSGKGILAFLPEAERDAIIQALPDPIPTIVPMTKSQLAVQLAEARARGFVVSHGERVSGAVGVSAPVRDATGRVIGDLIASWPDNRTNRQKEHRVADRMVASADEVSRLLGYRSADRPDRPA